MGNDNFLSDAGLTTSIVEADAHGMVSLFQNPPSDLRLLARPVIKLGGGLGHLAGGLGLGFGLFDSITSISKGNFGDAGYIGVDILVTMWFSHDGTTGAMVAVGYNAAGGSKAIVRAAAIAACLLEQSPP